MSEDHKKGDQSQDKENVERRKPGDQPKQDPSKGPAPGERQTDEGEAAAGKGPQR